MAADAGPAAGHGRRQADAALAGTDLDYSQRQACKGLLTSKRLINCLVAPAGTGKTHVMARVRAGLGCARRAAVSSG